MKKLTKIFTLVLAIFVVTGCVKQTVHMDITDDGKVTMTAISAVASSVSASDVGIVGSSDEDKAALEKLGYTVEDYEDDDMTGIQMTKTYTLSKVSSKEEKEVHLEDVGTEDFDDSVLFQTVKSGLFSSTYKANFVFDTTTDDSDSYSSYASSFEITYSVTLPRAPKSHNADSVDGNTLTWNVTYGESKAINYEFEVKNNTVLYVGIAALVIVIIAVVVVVMKKKGKKDGMVNTENVSPVPPTNPGI